MRYWLAFLFLLLPLPVLATPVVADLSNYRIDIDSGFNGTRLFLFGARNDNGDIVVVIRGPHKDYIVRKKEKIAGLWVNRSRVKFLHVPDFYVMATSRELPEGEAPAVYQQLGIGETHLLQPAGVKIAANTEEFAAAFLRYQHARRLYAQMPGGIGFMGETLFKSTIEFPDNIPPGDYTAEIYLISGGEIAGMQSTPIKVVKSGVGAFFYRYAHESPALYGIAAVALALAAGWFAGRVFEHI